MMDWLKSLFSDSSKAQAERTQTLQPLSATNEIYLSDIFNISHAGIGLLNCDLHFVKVNHAFCELFGYSEDTLLNMKLDQLIEANDLPVLSENLNRLVNNEIRNIKAEFHCIRKNNEKVWVSLIISNTLNKNNQTVNLIVQAHDITMQKKAEERLRHMAYHDPLTGLANRNQLEQFVNQILAQSRRHQQSFALIFIDLDRFKVINDTIGHEAGDLLLQIIADRLRGNIRNTDLVARLGGDEFVVVITDVYKTESVAIIAQKILESVMQAVAIKGQEIYITTSIGISIYPFDGQNMQTLVKNADLALYRAKEQGKNNYQFYTEEMTFKAKEKLTLQTAIAHAVANNELSLSFMPNMELKTRKVNCVEALLRWKNKEFNFITPDEIISLAEETGLILPVNNWILLTACKTLKTWHQQGHRQLTMSINCSSRQFKQANLANSVMQTLSENGISPHQLEFEVTEKLIMDDPDTILRALYALKDLGVQISIDDFGTGYWSLSNLQRLAVDRIKIDKTFTKQITTDETSADIVKAIIAMVNKLGIRSVAEGVETREQYKFLEKEGCTEIQGYYLTQPLTEDAMSLYLKHPVPTAETKDTPSVTPSA